jgi:hypothetical protein
MEAGRPGYVAGMNRNGREMRPPLIFGFKGFGGIGVEGRALSLSLSLRLGCHLRRGGFGNSFHVWPSRGGRERFGALPFFLPFLGLRARDADAAGEAERESARGGIGRAVRAGE